MTRIREEEEVAKSAAVLLSINQSVYRQPCSLGAREQLNTAAVITYKTTIMNKQTNKQS